MSLFGWTPPCEERDPLRRDAQLSALVDRADARAAPVKLRKHAAGCERCGAALGVLRAQRDALASFGDAPGAAPDEAELRRVLFALSADRRVRRPAMVWAFAAAACAVVLCGSLGARRWLGARARDAEDAQILAGADAAFRRAEHEYSDAIALLRTRLELVDGGHIDSRVAQGAKALDAAREQAASLARERHGDSEREALLREAERVEVRYYQDALLRGGVAPEPAGTP